MEIKEVKVPFFTDCGADFFWEGGWLSAFFGDHKKVDIPVLAGVKVTLNHTLWIIRFEIQGKLGFVFKSTKKIVYS